MRIMHPQKIVVFKAIFDKGKMKAVYKKQRFFADITVEDIIQAHYFRQSADIVLFEVIPLSHFRVSDDDTEEEREITMDGVSEIQFKLAKFDYKQSAASQFKAFLIM